MQKRVLGLFDVAYTNESGLPELVDAAEDVLKGQTVIEEKHIMERFFKELVKDNGLAAYGEQSVRANLELGSVDMLLLSDKLRKSRLVIKCDACGYTEQKTVQMEAGKDPSDLDFGPCPKCTSPLQLEEEFDIIDELTQLADQSNSSVSIISDDFEEGSQLYSAFGGIAAILRYRTGF